MQNADFVQGQAQANPDFMEALVRASESYSIIASKDIVDVRGLKLWAKGQPVSAALQQRLLERKLLHPIESCLEAPDGVTLVHLVEQAESFLQSGQVLAAALRPWAGPVLQELRQLPLHSVAQLLLTTMHATRPQALAHAVVAMVMAGYIAQQQQSSPADVRLALLGGLLHDIGETYIQPQYLDHDGDLDIVGHKHMMVHSRVAQLMLEGTTDYPKALSRAVGEHHERQDGSGYPAVLAGNAISPLGALLAVAETTAGIARTTDRPFTRASFALRVVPGEYSQPYASVVFSLAQMANEESPAIEPADTPAQTLQRINESLQQAQLRVQDLSVKGMGPASADLVTMAQNRLARLRVAWNSLGVWGLHGCDVAPQDLFEMQLAEKELQRRLHGLHRECLLRAQHLSADQQLALRPLWEGMALLT